MKVKKIGRRKPDWLKIKLPREKKYVNVNRIIKQHKLNTICTSGRCPNMGDCWDKGTATLMILGDICTRACKFCAVKTGKPNKPDKKEAINIAKSVNLLKLKHCVLTSVDRDDLLDKGSKIWADTIIEVKKLNPKTTIEALIPDFDAVPEFIQKVIDAKPEVISHNLETVKRLTPKIRSRAKYNKSIKVIKYLSDSGIISKSGIMVGLGETYNEVIETMDDLISVGCKVITIGQYLQPTTKHLEVVEYIKPEVFEKWKTVAYKKGFIHVESAPLVRSSYNASNIFSA